MDLGLPNLHTELIKSVLQSLEQPLQKLVKSIPKIVSSRNYIEKNDQLTSKIDSFRDNIFNYLKTNISNRIDKFLDKCDKEKDDKTIKN